MRISIFFLLFLYSIENSNAQFKINESSYVLELGADQSYQSVFVKYDEKREELYRVVKMPKPTVEIFNLNTGKLKRKVSPKLKSINSIAIIRDNGFWTFEDNRTFVHFDLLGNIIKEIKEQEPVAKNGLPSYFIDFDFNPLILFKSNLYLAGSFMQFEKLNHQSFSYTNHGVIRSLDLSNDKLNWKASLPASTMKNNYGYLNRYSMAKNGTKLVVSPYFSDEIQIYDLISNKTYFPVQKENKYSKLVVPFSPISDKKSWEPDSLYKHFVSNYRFIGILYDQYRDIYYRFLVHPNNGFNDPNYTILILDNVFKMIGGYELPEEYVINGAFVSKKGLNLVDYQSYKRDDSKLIYHSFLFQ